MVVNALHWINFFSGDNAIYSPMLIRRIYNNHDSPKNHLDMFPEIPYFFFLNVSKCSKYLKNIWLHFINITVKTQN